jgi:hypothetical protein
MRPSWMTGSVMAAAICWATAALAEAAARNIQAAPINIPTPSTMAPPSTIWNAACRNGVSM